MIKKVKKKNGTTVYVVRVKDRYGRWFPQKTCHNKILAQTEELNLKKKAAQGKVSDHSGVLSKKVSDLWHVWSEDMRANISGGWKSIQTQFGRDYILPQIGHVRFSEVQPIHVRKILGVMEKKGLSQQTQKLAFNTVRKMFADICEAYELDLRNPARRNLKPKVPKAIRNHLGPNDARKLLAFVRSDIIGPAVWLGIGAGMRYEAIAALRWSAINFDQSYLVIRAGYKRRERVIKPYPKGKDWHRVPLSSDLAAYLQNLSQGKSGDDLVSPGTSGEIMRYEYLLYRLKKICKEAQVPEVTPHELRHSAPELLYHAGATDEDVRQFLGHKDTSTVLTYKHRSPERLAEITSQIFLSPKLSAVE